MTLTEIYWEWQGTVNLELVVVSQNSKKKTIHSSYQASSVCTVSCKPHLTRPLISTQSAQRTKENDFPIVWWKPDQVTPPCLGPWTGGAVESGSKTLLTPPPLTQQGEQGATATPSGAFVHLENGRQSFRPELNLDEGPWQAIFSSPGTLGPGATCIMLSQGGSCHRPQRPNKILHLHTKSPWSNHHLESTSLLKTHFLQE